jgi:photosynthetic reaction center cytochrome c subunit
MMHMSDSLGVNCTYCHNSRAWYSWEQSHPQRVIAWYGIRMVRALNNEYLVPLGPTYPEHRLGPLGDAPKANCATCHQGVYKPLYGADMIGDYPELTVASP